MALKTKFGTANIYNGSYQITSRKEGNHSKKLHRLIYEDYHNITLLQNAAVHHIDGDKLNNDISNLEIIGTSESHKYTKFGLAKINDKGYYVITSQKEGNNGKYLHRLIFEDFYQIKLLEDTVIHHEDGNPLNNEIWNLVPMTRAEHNTIHKTGEKFTIERKLNVSSTQNSTGYFRVYKSYEKGPKQGFRWVYRWRENGKQRSIKRIDINKLKEKVLEKGLEWIELKEVNI